MVLTVSNVHDGLDLCSRQPQIMHAPELPAPTSTKGSEAPSDENKHHVQASMYPLSQCCRFAEKDKQRLQSACVSKMQVS